jgi:3-hydroxyisobutyrate dehydrogenase-like beta-hydroxyacid dehydrogenase
MTKILAEATVLMNALGLDESRLREIEQAMRNCAASAVNAAVPLIEKREKPDVVRKFMEPIGLTYSGKTKLFS